MKHGLVLMVLILSIMGCSVTDTETELITSPSEKYMIKATVNKIDKDAEDYADVVIYLYNSRNNKIDSINSKVGDFSKWAIGWTELYDTIVIYSSDIGNKAWRIIDDNLQQVSVDDGLNQRANELKKKKYN